jgi:hypothetical protein
MLKAKTNTWDRPLCRAPGVKKTEVTTCGDQTGAYLYYTLLHMYSIYVYIELYYHHYTDVLLSLCGMIYELVSTLSNS